MPDQNRDVHRVVPGIDPGITRVKAEDGFVFVGPDGQAVTGEDLARCRALVLPPAWVDVWISLDPDGHIQAVGTDEAGREQYRYHPTWREHRAHAKFGRMLQLASALPRVFEQYANGRTMALNGSPELALLDLVGL